MSVIQTLMGVQPCPISTTYRKSVDVDGALHAIPVGKVYIRSFTCEWLSIPVYCPTKVWALWPVLMS